MCVHMAHLNVPARGNTAHTHARSCNRKRLVRTCIYNEARWDHRTMPAQPIASQLVGWPCHVKRACEYTRSRECQIVTLRAYQLVWHLPTFLYLKKKKKELTKPKNFYHCFGILDFYSRDFFSQKERWKT